MNAAQASQVQDTAKIELLYYYCYENSTCGTYSAVKLLTTYLAIIS